MRLQQRQGRYACVALRVTSDSGRLGGLTSQQFLRPYPDVVAIKELALVSSRGDFIIIVLPSEVASCYSTNAVTMAISEWGLMSKQHLM